jgi:glycosyltransferase involved in cell wall biosynthesis/peptidoglycan/xylan/chitin deacetylase (PgdA/CDA1 family)
MKISVVVTTYNRCRSLKRCLKSLAGQNFPSEDFEIVVVSDGCTDGTIEFLRSFSAPCAVVLIEQQNKGQACSQNIGAVAAHGDLVLFMDDDCECHPNLLATHVESHGTQENLLVIGTVGLHNNSPAGLIFELKLKFTEDRIRRLSTRGASRADMMLCANSSIRREAVLSHPFDPTYLRIHDVELGVRLWEEGYRPQFASEAVVYEFFSKNAKDIIRDSYLQGKFEVRLTRAHPGYKPLAGIAEMNNGSILRRILRKQMARSPRLADFVLRGIQFFSSILGWLYPFHRLALAVLSARFVTGHFNGALQEAGSWQSLEDLFGKRTPVIIFHNIGDPRANEYPGLTTPVLEFEKQLDLIASLGYTTIRPAQWLAWRDQGELLPRKPIMLVFDDAYEEVTHTGFPILEQRGMSAACMVVTKYIGTTNRWDENAGRPSFRLMAEDEIREWSERGIEFGGHSDTHADLSLATDEILQREVKKCRERLMDLLGLEPCSFAYPFGRFNPAAQRAVLQHFRIGFTSNQGRLHLGTNLSEVPRIFFVPGESWFGMWCKLRLGRNPADVVRVRTKRLFNAWNFKSITIGNSAGAP